MKTYEEQLLTEDFDDVLPPPRAASGNNLPLSKGRARREALAARRRKKQAKAKENLLDRLFGTRCWKRLLSDLDRGVFGAA